MKISETYRLKCFDPVSVMNSGQCFRWHELCNGRVGVISSGKYIEMSKERDGVSFTFDEADRAYWSAYFDLDFDYERIEKLIEGSGDEHLKEAFSLGSGVRILKQDLWETIVSFMISQNNNIGRIRNSIEAICERAGIEVEGGYAFPGPFDLDVSVFDDKTLGLGYRAPYLKEIFSFAKENPDWLDDLSKMDYEKAMKSLLERTGIGPKVANCICLFGLHHVDAFPVDTHVKQLLSKYYQNGFDFEYYKGVAGIIQQYLFCYELKSR